VLFAVIFEAISVAARGRPVRLTLEDSSAVLAGWLLALAIPPLAPVWILLVATFFAIVVAKHLYGGLGYNPFNPAMVGYVVVLISFPREISLWPAPEGLANASLGFLQVLQAVLTGQLPAGLEWDALTRASPLDVMRSGLVAGQTIGELVTDSSFGSFSQTEWEWAGNLFFLGGLWLLYRRVITWHIPVAMLGTLGVLAGLFWVIDPDQFASPAFHIFSGAAIIGAFFIATDPVSASTTPLGKILFGAGIGLLTFVIRTWGGYPDGVAFAVLLMNMVAPTLDHYTRPRIFGQPRGPRE
jgi:electron transport complex protein RnfD